MAWCQQRCVAIVTVRCISSLMLVANAHTCRAAERAALQQYTPVQLLITKGELQAGLEAHESCPDMLKGWLRRDSMVVTTGVVLDG